MPLRSVLLFLLLASSSAFACSVPVFRYALEHWAADPYRLTLPHGAKVEGNFKVTHSDAPKIELRLPVSTRREEVIWSAEHSEASLAMLLDSPARQQIAERLGAGESAVWVLLESGDKAQDETAAKFLDERLEYLSGIMELPRLDEQDIKNGLVSIPADGLRLAFSTVRLKRDDAAESAFIAMLLASEPDLREVREPIAFPIFGQGRVLYALVGKGIKVETVDRAAHFLIGSCSCQVKEQNPGADLVMAVDWKKLVQAQLGAGQELPELSQIADLLPQTVKIESLSPSLPAPSVKRLDWRIGVGIVVAGAITVLLLRRFWN